MLPFEFLNPLPLEQQSEILGTLPVKIFKNDEVIFERGDASTDIYFILEGATKSVNFGANGKMAYFRMRQAGECLGYYSGISGEPRTSNMIAVGDTKLAVMQTDDFMHLVTHTPLLAEKMLKLVMGILRKETDRLTHMITLNSAQLICAELLAEAGQNISNNIDLPSREELAGKLGMTRETLSRELNKLIKNGLIAVDKKIITLLKVSDIEDIAYGTPKNI